MNAPAILTVGHSNHPIDVFLKLLETHAVEVLADVRSAPYSRFNPQFNRKALAAALADKDVAYLYLGRALGGRPDDPQCYDQGRVDYDRVARTDRFQEGLERLLDAAADNRVAIMCAEKEPLDCHRTLLVGQQLDGRGVDTRHILANGEIESHQQAIDRLLARHHLSPAGDLLATREEFIATAIGRQTGLGSLAGQSARATRQEQATGAPGR